MKNKVFSPLESLVHTHHPDCGAVTLHPWLLGTIFFMVQLMLILCFCFDTSVTKSWLSLASHWDSEWYEAIAQYGYINLNGPDQTGLLNANVVFFPGYPYLARLLILCFGMNAKVALLVISQISTWLFWCLFFHIVRAKPWYKQGGAALLIMTFPTSWFMYVAYSEALFILTCCLMVWFSIENKRYVLSAAAGFCMTATRIIGLPVLIAPLCTLMVVTLSSNTRESLRDMTKKLLCVQLLRLISPKIVVAVIASLGCIGFLVYCAMAFDSWHLYFDMERIGWKGTPDPLFLFKSSTWLPPPFGYDLDFAPSLPHPYGDFFPFKFFKIAAYSFSEVLVPLFLWLSILFSIRLFKKNRTLDPTSLTWYFAAILIFLFTCISLSTRHYESMSRCLYPFWILLILSDVMHPDGVLFFRLPKYKLFIAIAFVSILSSAFWLQLLIRFYLGWWVA